MSIGTKFRPRATPITALLPKTVYMHVLDSTDRIPGNRPVVVYTTNRVNPFGKPGRDYSQEYPWTFYRLERKP